MSTSQENNSAQSLDTARNAYAQWRKAVEEELKGAPFDKKLITRTFEGVALQPLYIRPDAESLTHLGSAPGQAPFVRGTQPAVGGKAWEVSQEIAAPTAADFNAALLSDLNRGQNSVALVPDRAARGGLDPAANVGVGADGVSIADLTDVSTALRGVELAHIPVHVKAGSSALPIAALYVANAKKAGVKLSALTGSLTADPLSEWAERGQLPAALEAELDELAGWVKWAKKNAPALSTVGVSTINWADAGANAVQELAIAVAAGVEYLRELKKRRVTVETAASKIRFSFAIGPQFFTELAKFRAFRLLWSRAVVAFEAPAEAAAAKVHARTGRWNKTVLDLHNNMLRVTTEALSAVLGGVDSLHIAPFDEVLGYPDDFSRRIARNVHTILAEEFRTMAPADPAGGSWYIEKLTDELARKAWTLFQEIEKQGGYAAALRSGWLQKTVATVSAEKDDAINKRRSALVGTNLFPNLKEKPYAAKTVDLQALAATRAAEIARRRPNSIDAKADAKWDTKFASAIAAATAGATVGQLQKLASSDAAATAVTPVKPHRAAEGFEALRAAVDAFAKKTGARPKVFVAKMGPVLQHKARADFTAGFFGVGGFELIAKQTFETAESAAAAAVESGAPITVLCSTDDTYPVLAPVFVKAVKAAKPAVNVILAGYPTEHIEAFKAAGFDDFIHIRANVRELLSALLNKIGASA